MIKQSQSISQKQKRQRFWKRLQQRFGFNSESEVVAEFQLSRNQTISALRYSLLLLLIPLLINQTTKVIIVEPLIQQFENQRPAEVLLEGFQEERILKELQTYKSRLRFELLLQGNLENSASIMEAKLQNKAVDLAEEYREGNTQVVKNVVADFLALVAFLILILKGQSQIKILMQFLSQLSAGLSDSAKAFLIILVTNIFVGFHSSYGWDVILNGILYHYGLAENKQFVGLFIATFPVTLDAIGKYWIFRYLNRVSPSAVVTYRTMNE
ncbi:CemA family protein (plasmid) [Leptolyngbya sp. NIES-3755]|nr:CemA family protein [Leptolyngbya sp. NIES-3755]